MAQRLHKFDWSKSSTITPRTDEKAAYPWTDWFDGDIWKITQGVDFDRETLMMERIIRTRAVNHKAKVQVRHLPDEKAIVFQRTDIEGPRSQALAERRAKRATKRASADAEAAELVRNLSRKGVNGRRSKTPTKVA